MRQRGCVGAPGTKEVEMETKTTVVVDAKIVRKKPKGIQLLIVGAFQARHARQAENIILLKVLNIGMCCVSRVQEKYKYLYS
ncbi:hypothetical protein J6590_086697 [Homalodisca vitripennis]|nr:hypothetical protein J6590_086697 [Homalodisca vitripennis]